MKSPLISIITVVRNGVDTIGVTLDSVMSQSFQDYEHIVMDGVSDDGTLEKVTEFQNPKLRVFSSHDRGIYDAMNKALAEAKGRFVLFLNAGDSFASPSTLQRFAQAIESNPDIIYGQTVLVDNARNILGPRHLSAPEELSYKSFATGMVVCHQAFMVRREIAPLYNTDFKFSADYDWCIRCLHNSVKNTYLGPEPVIHYLSEGLTTRNHKNSLKERFRIMAHYYGSVPTILRHIKFLFRYARRRTNAPNKQ